MGNEQLDRVIEAMVRIPSITRRKIHQDVFRIVLEQVGPDIALHHIIIMKVLQESGKLHSSEIGDMTAIAKPQITHSIDNLVKKGLVERRWDARDRRKINIRLTQKGRDKLEIIDEIIRSHLKARLSTLSDDELEKLADSFQYVAQIFSKLQ